MQLRTPLRQAYEVPGCPTIPFKRQPRFRIHGISLHTKLAGPCDSHNPLSSRSSELVTWQAKLARCKRLIDVDRLVASCSLLPSLRFPDIKKGMVPLGWEGQKIQSFGQEVPFRATSKCQLWEIACTKRDI